MRRKDRLVTEVETVQEIVENCHVVRVGLFDETYPYVVPTNYGYEWLDNELIIYIHGARIGKKIECIQKNPHVCVEMDGAHQLISGGRTAAKYSFAYQSFIGFGKAEILEDVLEKKHGLELLMWHELKHHDYDEMPTRVIEKTGVIKITVEKFTAKEHAYPAE